MLMIAMLGLLSGAVLAIHFRVLVLVPATFLGSAVAVMLTYLRGEGLWGMMLALGGGAVALQIGYLCGCFLQHVTAHLEPSVRRRCRPAAR
jgi:hypothetical protein